MLEERADRHESRHHLTREQRRGKRTRALVRHMQHIYACHRFHQLAGEMEGRADTRAPESDFPRVGSGERKVFLRGIGPHPRPHHQYERRTDHLTHRGKIRDEVVGHILEQSRMRYAAAPDGYESMPVRRLFGSILDADPAVRANFVFDQDRLAKRRAQRFGEDARQVIRYTTRRERHYDADRTARTDLGGYVTDAHAQHGRDRHYLCNEFAPRVHEFLLVVLSLPGGTRRISLSVSCSSAG